MRPTVRLAICDDDDNFRSQAHRMLDEYFLHSHRIGSFDEYSSATSLLEKFRAGARYDVYLLDIVMPGVDGIQLAREIRKLQPEIPIVFFTTSSDYAIEAFTINAAHYVVKPFDQDVFNDAINRALASLPAKAQKCTTFKTSEGIVKVPIDNLVSSVTDEHYQIVQISNGTEIVSRMSGQELWQTLEPYGDFVRIGLKYIVNLKHVKLLSKKGLTLSDDRFISVPRRVMSDVKKAYVDYCCP